MRSTEKEKFERELSSVKSELNVEQKTKAILEDKVSSLEKKSLYKLSVEEDIHRSLVASLSTITTSPDWKSLVSSGALLFEETLDLLESRTDSKAIGEAIVKLLGNIRVLIDELKRSHAIHDELQSQCTMLSSQAQVSHEELEQLRHEASENSHLRSDLMDANQRIELAERERDEKVDSIKRLEADLQAARSAELEFSRQLETTQSEVKGEMDNSIQRWTMEKSNAEANAESVLSKLQSIWEMMERAMGSDQASEIETDTAYSEEGGSEKLGVATLRASSSMVDEIVRRRSEASELSSKLTSSDRMPK